MTTKVTLVAIGLSLVLLTGCGDSNNSNNGDNNTNTNEGSNMETTVDLKNSSTLEEMKTSIIGSWFYTCINEEEGVWGTTMDTYKSDNTVVHEEKKYSEADCNENALIEEFSISATYALGEKVTDSEGQDAFELDLIDSDFAMYKIARIVDDKLHTSYRTDALDETSEETRSNTIDTAGTIRQ